MTELLIFIGVIIVAIVGLAIASYNKLIRLQQNVTEAKSGIDVQMKRKANMLGNLLDAVKMQGEFEQSTMQKIVEARAGLMSNDLETKMTADVTASNLFKMVAEAYPTLGTNEGYKELMLGIKDVEDKVGYARNRYNVAVVTYNTVQKTFPTMLFAGLANCSEEKVYELNRAEFEATDNMRIGNM